MNFIVNSLTSASDSAKASSPWSPVQLRHLHDLTVQKRHLQIPDIAFLSIAALTYLTIILLDVYLIIMIALPGWYYGF